MASPGGYTPAMHRPLWRTLALGLIAAASALSIAQNSRTTQPAAGDFQLKLLHFNDTHGHIESSRVNRVPVGGFARLATLIQRERKESPNTILLHAGDVFQGTLYFNVYEGLADLAFMNWIKVDAMALGNHEFDKGPAPLATFLQRASFPGLAANLDVSAEPSLRSLVKPSTIIRVGSERVGVVGAITEDLPDIASPGPNVKLIPLVASIQKEVDGLTRQGVNKIILLSHCGFSVDQGLAKQLRGVDVIVGGHSHTLLGKVEIPGFDGSRGSYPTRVKGIDSEVLVVQAWEWGKVLGRLNITFDRAGRIKSDSGGPILVDEKTPEDPFVAGMVAAFRKPIEALMTQPVGELATSLNQRWTAESGEGLMGSVIADAQLAATQKLGAVAAFMNAGGVRAPLEKGKITYGQLVEVQPFGNTLVVLELTGTELRAAIEHGVSEGGMLLPSKGTSYRYDPNAPKGSRVKEVVVAGKPLEPAAKYMVTFNSFLAAGGDAHAVLKEAAGKRIDTGLLDLDALIDYFKANNPVSMQREGRIQTGSSGS